MNDVFESLKDTLRERLSSPLLGPYFIAFLACNYKAFLFVFSDLAPAEKVAAIDALYSSEWALLFAFGIPLVFAAFYVFIYPYPARYIMRFTLYQNRVSRKIQQQILEETPLTVSESQELIRGHQKNIDSLEQEVTRFQLSSDRWKAEAGTKDREINSLKDSIAALNEALKLKDDRIELGHARESDLERALSQLAGINSEILSFMPEEAPSRDVVMSDGRTVKMTYTRADDYLPPRLKSSFDKIQPLLEQIKPLLELQEKMKERTDG